MAASLLLSVPFEIREKIYIETFTTSTRLIKLQNNRPKVFDLQAEQYPDLMNNDRYKVPQDKISFSLLQTCRKIYLEARNIVYEHNTFTTFFIEELVPSAEFALPPPIATKLSSRLQKVWIATYIQDSCDNGYLSDGLAVLLKWAQDTHQLKSVTLSFSPMADGFFHFLDCWIEEEKHPSSSDLHKYLQILNDSWVKHEDEWGSVKRRIELLIENNLVINIDPRPPIQALHDNSACELWINGKLCYAAGKELLPAFAREKDDWRVLWPELEKAEPTQQRIEETQEGDDIIFANDDSKKRNKHLYPTNTCSIIMNDE